MKTFLAFILISASSAVVACGPYYPYGEGVRFSLFKPAVFPTEGLNGFHFTTSAFMPDEAAVKLGEAMNVRLWRRRCGNTVPEPVVYEVIYGSGKNSFYAALYDRRDFAAIDYLGFAKECSDFNTHFDDPWERNAHSVIPRRGALIQQALKKAAEVKDDDISGRYAFLAIRMAFYNADLATIESTYNRYFAGRKDKTIVDYWSLYFRAITEKNAAKRSFYAAQVFANAPDKRFVIHSHFSREAALKDVLAFAETNEERSAVWTLHAVRNQGKALESIRHVGKLTPRSPLLSLLLLREMNKLEDWIFTPYYSEFDPSLSEHYWDNINARKPASRQRMRSDRHYASQLLEIVRATDLTRTQNPELWKSAAIYLQFMTEEYDRSLELIRAFEQSGDGSRIEKEQVDVLKALCLTAIQPQDSAVITDEIKPILLRESAKKNNRFLFAIARELEYKGNTTDAAILLSRLDGNEEFSDNYDYPDFSSQYWKSKKGFQTLYYDVYNNYFFYIDATYTPEQVQTLITHVQDAEVADDFDRWKYRSIRKSIPRLFDLLGTKYIRKDQLNNALRAFEKVNDTLWTSKYHPYAKYLDANPFYTNMYNEHTHVPQDKMRYNKESLTRKLIAYLRKAENPKTKKRAHYYFLVANCRLNMSFHGNSWLMKRYYSSQGILETGLEDDSDYYNCDAAKRFYLKARSVSKNRQFQALCLRMAGRCEKYRLLHEWEMTDYRERSEEDRDKKVFRENRYFRQIKAEYPDDYEELIGNCESFDRYFEAGND